MHSLNGNKKSVSKSLKILQINTGRANFNTDINELKTTLDIEKPSLVIISEANFGGNIEISKEVLNGFNFEAKFMPGHPLARVVILIKKGLKYSRLNDFDNDLNSSVFIKIKL